MKFSDFFILFYFSKNKGKSTPFQSPLGLRIPLMEQAGRVKQVEEERCGASDKVIFEKFKHTDEEKEDFVGPLCADELENSVADDIQESRKRKDPFEGLPFHTNKFDIYFIILTGSFKPLLRKNGSITVMLWDTYLTYYCTSASLNKLLINVMIRCVVPSILLEIIVKNDLY